MCLERFLSLTVFSCLFLIMGGCDGDGLTMPADAPDIHSSPVDTSRVASRESAAPPATTEKEGNGGNSWGDLKGRFIFDGKPPVPSPLEITKDEEFCGQHAVFDESLLVNPENGGLANTIVFLYTRYGQPLPRIHKSYAETAGSQVVMENSKCRFEPHICVMRTTQTLLISNSDRVGHNMKADMLTNPSFNQTIPSGNGLEIQFAMPERKPAAVTCSIHPWMKGWLMIQATPYIAISDKNGEFHLRHLPAGTWTFQAWHEKPGNVDKVSLQGQSTIWSKGRFEVTIQAETTTDLGEIKISPDLFVD